MIERKIQLVGKRSYSVSLPKEWITANKLSAHDVIFLNKESDNSLIIQTQQTPQNSALEFSLTEIPMIDHFLAVCYQKNISQLTLKAKKISPEQRATISKMLKHLDGFEIVNETQTSITIDFLFKDLNINLQKITIRMVFLLKFMLNSIHEKNDFALTENENALDRLYYLGQRILFASTYNNKLRRENEIEHTEDIFSYLHIIKKIEQLGDVIENLENISKKEYDTLYTYITFLEKLFVKRIEASKLKKEFEKISNSKILEKNGILFDRARNLTDDILLNAVSFEFNKKFFN